MGARERTWTLFVVAAGMAVFVYHELGRRQSLGEHREETRREWVDGKLADHDRALDGHRERAASRVGVARTLAGVAAVAAAAVTIWSLVR